MDDAMGLAAVALVFGALVAGGVTTLIVRRAASGRLRLNRVSGIRTRHTMTSEAAWESGHRAALPWALRVGAVGAAGALVTLVLTLLSRSTAGVAVGAIALAVMTVLSVLMARAADAAAAETDPGRGRRIRIG